MKDFVLLLATMGMFVFGYFIVKKMDQFLEENAVCDCEGQPGCGTLLRIAAESPVLLDSIAPVMEECSGKKYGMEFGVTSANAEKLLQRLGNGAVDFVLLTAESASKAGGKLEAVVLPKSQERSVQAAGLSVYELEKEKEVYVLWNPSIPSKPRDRMAAILCREAALPHKMCG